MDDKQNTFKYHYSAILLYFKKDIKIRMNLNNVSLDVAEYNDSILLEVIGFFEDTI